MGILFVNYACFIYAHFFGKATRVFFVKILIMHLSLSCHLVLILKILTATLFLRHPQSIILTAR